MENAALILEGGATRGVFTSGVLDYLMEQDFYTSYVIGVSAGSCNAVDYVSKQIERTKKCMLARGEGYSYYYGLKGFVKEKSLLDMDLVFDKFPKEIYPFDFETYFQSNMKCEIVTTNCVTGKAEYLSEVNGDGDRLLKICRASSSMPLVCPIVNVDGVPYLDGGLADSVPIRHTQELGYKKIVVVLTRPYGYRKKLTSKATANMYRRLYKKYPNVIRTSILRPVHYNRTMEYIERLEAEGKIFVIRPQEKPVSRLEKDVHKLEVFYEHGYEYMKEQLPALREFLSQKEDEGQHE